MTTQPEIVGMAGTLGSGKDTAADILSSFGYTHISTSDIVRAEARERHQSVDREVLRHTANELRTAHGAGALCLRAMEMFEDRAAPTDERKLVISGIRAVGEVELVREKSGLMVFVDAPVEVRFARILARLREGDTHPDLETFRAAENLELSAAQAGHQDINAVRTMSDVLIQNTAGIDELRDSLIRNVVPGFR